MFVSGKKLPADRLINIRSFLFLKDFLMRKWGQTLIFDYGLTNNHYHQLLLEKSDLNQ